MNGDLNYSKAKFNEVQKAFLAKVENEFREKFPNINSFELVNNNRAEIVSYFEKLDDPFEENYIDYSADLALNFPLLHKITKAISAKLECVNYIENEERQMVCFKEDLQEYLLDLKSEPTSEWDDQIFAFVEREIASAPVVHSLNYDL